MRRITRTVLTGMLALVVPAALLAQHGFVSGRQGVGTAHGFSAGSGHPFAAPRIGTAPFGLRSPAFAGYTGILPGALRSRGAYGYRGRDFRRVPYGYFFAPYYYPFLDYANSAYPDYGPGFDAPADPESQGGLMPENVLGDQINRLGAEVEQLKYGQPPQPPALQAQEQPQPPPPPVMLVLRNGQQLKVENYAVMDQTFWDFSSQPTKKIPIANIDIAASAKATAVGGGEFPQLESGPQQAQ